MNHSTPFLPRLARLLVFVGPCVLACGVLISRPALVAVSLGLTLIGLSGAAAWNLWKDSGSVESHRKVNG